ncbi:hypothetical protein MSHOH_1368 [Methanosarcina horonobensis HB-1 = JCM 15518]|uniref:Uncharacterized protein n=1 Tax=Methanosarcina horonobensis HB-1 = JCM 15518 TaxID=1434110 RepID=A0A0E3SAL0_9EURY|nr:hypothetical protein [Methanosarcina horonobensis]AKB77851.1 hypothetical protein MSHOH_1368 [Methanosarcina horonobensis HB-1 = JCM 15518]
MARKKGEISQSGVKQKIIIYILENNGPLEESKIREKLNKKDEKANQGNINRHLHELEDHECIVPTKTKKGRRKYNLWDITSVLNLESIRSQLHDIQLNEYEKSLAILLRKFGIDKKSLRYVYFFVLLRLSTSFFNACMNTDIKTLHSRAREIFNHDKGFKKEQRIEELLNECNAKHIKGKLNVELPKKRFREIMEELAQKNDEILEEYAWRVCGCYSEEARERKRSKPTGDNAIQAIKRNRSQNPSLFPLEPIPWIKSFYMKFRENIPELSKIEIEAILKTPDEYQNMCLEMEEILSLMRDQNKTFNRLYLDLLFEHFYYQDIFDGTASTTEITFAQNSKKIIEEYSKKKSEDDVDIIDELILSELRNISEVMAKDKIKIPSVLENISDDSKVVLYDLLNFYGYQHIIEKIEKSLS